MPRDQVFISYAREDVELMKEFRTMLDPLVRSGETAAWADTDIPPGANWSDEINQALASARIGVLLVSADFLASDFIMETEVPALEAAAATGELTLIWIATRHCLYEASPLSKYQAANNPEKPLAGLTKNDRQEQLAEICRQIQTAIQVSSAIAPSPVGEVTRDTAPATPVSQIGIQERLDLVMGLSAIATGQFNQILFVIGPPPGIIPSMPAPQADRATSFLEWAQGPGGCTIETVKTIYDRIITAQ